MKPTPETAATARFLPIAEVCAELGGIDRKTLHNLRKRDGFPKPCYVGARPVWDREELIAYVRAQRTPRPSLGNSAPQAA